MTLRYSRQKSSLPPDTQTVRFMVEQQGTVTLPTTSTDEIAQALSDGYRVYIEGIGYIIPSISGSREVTNLTPPAANEVQLGFLPKISLLDQVRKIVSFEQTDTVVILPLVMGIEAQYLDDTYTAAELPVNTGQSVMLKLFGQNLKKAGLNPEIALVTPTDRFIIKSSIVPPVYYGSKNVLISYKLNFVTLPTGCTIEYLLGDKTAVYPVTLVDAS